MSNNGEWMLGRPLKWYEKIIISSVITLCVFRGIYLSFWIVYRIECLCALYLMGFYLYDNMEYDTSKEKY